MDVDALLQREKLDAGELLPWAKRRAAAILAGIPEDSELGRLAGDLLGEAQPDGAGGHGLAPSAADSNAALRSKMEQGPTPAQAPAELELPRVAVQSDDLEEEIEEIEEIEELDAEELELLEVEELDEVDDEQQGEALVSVEGIEASAEVDPDADLDDVELPSLDSKLDVDEDLLVADAPATSQTDDSILGGSDEFEIDQDDEDGDDESDELDVDIED